MKQWTISYKGHEWSDSDALVGHYAAVAALHADTWETTSPWSSPSILASWLTVLLAADTGKDLEVVAAVIGRESLGNLLGCLSEREIEPVAETEPVA